MFKEEYDALNNKVKKRLFTADDLLVKLDRTLLYGYTCERDTWHVYINDGIIFTTMYKYDGEPLEIEINENDQYVPNKRLYPECCDYEFCRLLKESGINLPFTTWQDRLEKKIYYGKIL